MMVLGDEPTRARHPDERGWVEDTDGVRVAYELYEGPEPTVLLLPQMPVAHSWSWRGQIPYISRHFRLISIDPRGNGRSDRPRDPVLYSRERHVRDCVDVLDATGTERCINVSVSPRAVLNLALCVEHPERVAGAVFVTPQLWPIKEFVSPYTAGHQPGYEGYDKFNPHYWREDWEGFCQWFAHATAPHPHSTRQIEESLRHLRATDGETFAAATNGFRMYEREEALELARRIRCPVLVTQNGGRAFWPKECSGPFAEASGGRLHVFEGLGPGVPWRWPVAFNLVLREFCESIRAGA